MSNISISVKRLSKIYKLYDKPIDRLKESLHPLKKQYHREFYALNDVSFEIKKGETVGIIGHNGAGKSTLLKIITGVLSPSSGSVHINGHIASLLELGTGFNPEYTGIDNIYFHGSLMGYSREEMEAKIEHILAFADIGNFIYQPVKTYSSGMFARLGFAVAINVDPEILIVDEALAVGDMNFQAKCMTAMTRMQQTGTTILFVSHDIGSIKSLCDHAIYIKEGALKAIGIASEVAELYMTDMRLLSNNKYQTNDQVREQSNSKTMKAMSENVENTYFKRSKDFDEKVACFRHGTGEVKITFVELVDINDVPVIEAQFNQKVKIKIYIESYVDKKISVNFHLRDDKKNSIVTCNFIQAGKELLSVKSGDKFMVEYVLNLPLQHNTYSLMTLIANPVIQDVDIEYIDVIDDAYIFKIAKRPNATLWSKVDLFPTLSIKPLID